VTTDLESDLIGGLFGCDLDQINLVPNDTGTFLNVVFTNGPVKVSVACTDSPLLKWAIITGRRRLKCGFSAAHLRQWKVELSGIYSGWLTVRQL
jgi:hypothetical protein